MGKSSQQNDHEISIDGNKCTSTWIQNTTKKVIDPRTNPLPTLCISWVTCVNISIPMTTTSWPPVWPRGRNPFTPAVGKYFLPDSSEHAELGGTDWLSQKERRGVRDRLDKRRIKGKYRLACGFYECHGGGVIRASRASTRLSFLKRQR